MAAAIRREVRQVDPRQPVADVQPMAQYVSSALARPRLYTLLLGAFASLALLLAAVGLYGLMAYAGNRRTHEIGVRMALGAQPRDVLRSMLVDGARLAVAGLVTGIASAIALSRLVANLLYGVTTGDVAKPERDPRSLFDIDERLVDLMDRAEEAAEAGDIPQELLQEINDYLEAFRTKVDRIAGYWRWQESIARICGEEVERLLGAEESG